MMRPSLQTLRLPPTRFVHRAVGVAFSDATRVHARKLPLTPARVMALPKVSADRRQPSDSPRSCQRFMR
jgi:hypothetical protein